MPEEAVVIVGLGEVGKPLLNILSRTYDCVGVDIQPVQLNRPCSILHICIPFQIQDFLGVAAAYIAKYKPRVTILNSTVAPGTTLALASLSGAAVAYSPVRGKHVKMETDMLRYKKFVGADDPGVVETVLKHFKGAGFKTDRFKSAHIGEVSKLIETTWLGMLVAWAQEVERIAGHYGANYEDVNTFIEEIDFLPHIFPGYIGGHCVMPNIAILQAQLQSDFLDAIVRSNEQKRIAMQKIEATAEV